MTAPVRFDDSLPRFVDLIVEAWGEASIPQNLFLRDAGGRLTFVVVDGRHGGVEREGLARRASAALGGYTDTHGFAVATPDELFDDSLKDPAIGWRLPLATPRFAGKVRLVDRRVVGADWLRTPAPAAGWPPRLVFASLKGGVGRSTALCVLAAHLASRGMRVLTVDMDLEAPGLGNMLLTNETLPEFGLLDYLVETGTNPVEDDFYVDMVAPSWLGDGRGPVSVIPALGRRSLSNPVNVLAKIARAYLEQPAPEGKTFSVADRMRRLLAYFAERGDHDVILIDARAGLHETTAAAVVGLGGEVLLFGVDQPQTFAVFEVLLAHLATLPGQDWRERLHMVQAKAPLDRSKREAFSCRMQDLMLTYLWGTPKVEGVVNSENLKNNFDVEWVDDGFTDDEIERIISEGGGDMPNSVVAIAESSEFHDFDPASRHDVLTESYYDSTFGAFLTGALFLLEKYSPAPPESQE